MVSHVLLLQWIGYVLVDAKHQTSALTHIVLCVTLLQLTKSSSGSNSGSSHAPPEARHFITGINCWNVTEEEWQRQVFSTSNFPVSYLKNTDCTHVIRAPEDYTVQLDFRDKFNIERYPHCEFDYIEFRDGPYGYSPLIKRYCGDQFPPIITSTSRYLWIRFHSDYSLEFDGFRAVYKYLPNPIPAIADRVNITVCQVFVEPANNVHEGTISSDTIPSKVLSHAEQYLRPVDCTWEITIPHGYTMHLNFHEIVVRGSVCSNAFIEVYDGRAVDVARVMEMCNTGSSSVVSKTNALFLRVFAASDTTMPAFSAFYTLFTHAPCSTGQFDCSEDLCIADSLVCNERKNCPSNADELQCHVTTEAVAETAERPTIFGYHTILLVVVGSLLLVFLVVCICVTCLQRQHGLNNRKKNKDLEHLRQLGEIEEYDPSIMQLEMTQFLNHSPTSAARHAGDYRYMDGIGLNYTEPRRTSANKRLAGHRRTNHSSLRRSGSGCNHVGAGAGVGAGGASRSLISIGTQTPPSRRGLDENYSRSRSSSLEDVSEPAAPGWSWGTRKPRHPPVTVPITVTIEPHAYMPIARNAQQNRLSTFTDTSIPLINCGRSKSVKETLSNHIGEKPPINELSAQELRNNSSCPELRWQCPIGSHECSV